MKDCEFCKALEFQKLVDANSEYDDIERIYKARYEVVTIFDGKEFGSIGGRYDLNFCPECGRKLNEVVNGAKTGFENCLMYVIEFSCEHGAAEQSLFSDHELSNEEAQRICKSFSIRHNATITGFRSATEYENENMKFPWRR